MFDKLKNLLFPASETQLEQPKVEEPKKESKPRKPKVELTEKEKATAEGEPYVAITKVEIDPADINNGSFDLDWNDKFVANLIKQGYKIRADDTDAQIVDRWFQTVCRNIALEIYEQEQADPSKRSDVRIVQQRDIGNGRTEVS